MSSVNDPVTRILEKLDNVKPCSGGYSARCPVHHDQHNSLSIARGHDGRVLVYCHARCELEDILEALGLTKADLFPPHSTNRPPQSPGRRIVATYDYRDESGQLLYQVVRFEPKAFQQRRPDGNGDWIWNLAGTRRVPYRLPELLAADPWERVLIVEGEKDAERLAALSYVVTTNAGGAGKWTPELGAFFGGRSVVILPDNDDAGEQHAAKVAHSLEGIAREVRVARLPGLAAKGDVSDWLAADGK